MRKQIKTRQIGLSLLAALVLMNIVSLPVLAIYIAPVEMTAPVFPGAFTSTVTPDELMAQGYNYPHLVGTWEIRLNTPDNSYTIKQNGREMAGGVYTLTTETISFLDLSGPAACIDPASGSSLRGMYGWSLTAQSLELKAIQEQCGGRLLPFTIHPFTYLGSAIN